MYVAPLNLDYYFKKVFSDPIIAQKFLEDFLGVKIDEIEKIETVYKVTDDSAIVAFDYRCKINGHYVIIDMQQWYKFDVVKRFYIYHSLSSVLQLETIKVKSLLVESKKYESKNYDELLPVYTLIWMAHDTLGFTEDYVSFALFPEQSADFLKNDALWQTNDLEKIGKEREKVLTLLNNDTKNLSFMPKNRLIYMFQKNIVKNKKYSTYFDWFELAEKSRNKQNTQADFVQYEKNPVFMSLLQRIRQDVLEPPLLKEIDDYDQFLVEFELFKQVEHKNWRLEMGDQVREEIIIELRNEVKNEVRDEVKNEVRDEVKNEVRDEVKNEVRDEAQRNVVISAHKQGVTPDLIAAIAQIPVEKVVEIIEKYKTTLS